MGQHHAIPPESDVLTTQGHSELRFSSISVLAHTKQEEERKHNEGRNGLELGVHGPAKMHGET